VTGDETIWILNVQDEGCQLLRGRTPCSDRFESFPLELVTELSNPYAELGPAARAPDCFERTDLLLDHRRAELLHRYVRELRLWIERGLREHRIEVLNVFAPQRLLNALRRAWPIRAPKSIREYPIDLATRQRWQLERHPAILALTRPAANAREM
jgi:hypothetical protein